ncbi:uncharacterized protein [Venturia canescens]|uniref:uncharacterized protein n=1 Tax=Venturia canescens TaxID=32260 RepID=UPI001C9C64F2|nr:uncharacterized protein LOC122416808 [Venturia canescens]
MIEVTAVLFLIAPIFWAVLALLSLFHYRKLSLYRKVENFPGPPTLPFIGNAHYFMGDSSSIFNNIVKMVNSYPSPFKVWLGHRLFFVVYEPDQLESVFLSAKTIDKDSLYQFAKPWLGSGLFTASTEEWRIHRKLIAPTFNIKILESFVEIFAKQSEIMSQQMGKESGGGEFDVFEYVTLCTIDVICETAMGIKTQTQLDKDHRYIHSSKRVFEILWRRIFNIVLHPDFMFGFTECYREQNECIKYLHGVTEDVIRRKRNAMGKAGARLDEEYSEERFSTKKVFLDLLMELSDKGIKFTDKELRDEVNTMMIAGIDTTATANTFVLFMLANYPEIQEKVYEELCEIYGDEVASDRVIQSEDLARMVYLERVIKETLRLFPIAPIIIRKIQEDLDLNGRTLPRGTSIALALLKVHRCEKIWPDPLKFDPDRFLPEEVAKRHPYSFVPFSAGPRMCIGFKYAIMAVKVLVATVLRRYAMSKDETVAIEDIKLKAEIVLKPVTPMKLKIVRRVQPPSAAPTRPDEMIGSTAALFLTLIFCGIVASLLFYYRKWSLYQKAAKFPGPPTLPLIGNAHYFMGDSINMMATMVRLTNSYPSPFKIWMGPRLFTVIYEPEQLKSVLLSPKTIEREALYQLASPWLGDGILTASADKWRIHRKLIAPTFNVKILETFVEVFARQSEVMVEQMSKELGGGDFNVFAYVTLCTLDIICETAMGVTAYAQVEKDNVYVHSASRAFEIIWKRVCNIWLHSELIFSLTKLHRDQKQCIKNLHGVTHDVIQRKKNASGRIEKPLESEYSGSTKRKAFLDHLLELSDQFTEKEVKAEVNTMLIAANDTTGTVVTFALLMLANHPEIQQKAYEELCDIYGDEVSSNSPIQNEDLHRMIYLERVIKETLRLFPVAPIIGREVQEDLDIGDHTLPKGSTVIMGILKIHRWEKLWPDPLKFDPDRFLPEEVAKRHPYSYVPFSAGPRNCVGLRYAMMAMKTLVATVLRRYVLITDKISAVEDIKLKSEFILKPVDPIRLRIQKR